MGKHRSEQEHFFPTLEREGLLPIFVL